MSVVLKKSASAMAEAASSHPPELGDLLVGYLEQLGIDRVFGVPGGAIEPLYNALARSARRGGPRPVVARHESGAAFMADGYARETGKLGVCCSTTGPGATNLITGVASAYADGTPLLVITAQTALPQFGKRALQDSSCTAIDTVGMFRHCTRYNTLISHRGQLEGKLVAAIMAATGQKGPAHISIPSDILKAPQRLRENAGVPIAEAETLMQERSVVDIRAMEVLREEIEGARNIVIIAGNACGDAAPELMAFAETVGAPVVTGPQGKGWIDPFHPLYRGVYGFAGHESARRVLMDEQVDLILAVNSRLGETILCGGPEETVLNRKLIHIDSAPEHFSRSPMARLHVAGNPRVIFEILNRRLRSVCRGDGDSCPEHVGVHAGHGVFPAGMTLDNQEACFSEAVPLKPQRVMFDLARCFPEQARFFIDAGNSWSWATHYLHLRGVGRYHIGMGFGAMAWAIGAAVGAAVGNPGTPMVCITGDGSYLMSGQEITVAVEEALPVVFVVLNDRSLGMVKHGQRMGGGEAIAFELPPVDFTMVARAMGAQAFSIRTPEELASLDFAALCRRSGPTLIEMHIDPEEKPPMGARIKRLRG